MFIFASIELKLKKTNMTEQDHNLTSEQLHNEELKMRVNALGASYVTAERSPKPGETKGAVETDWQVYRTYTEERNGKKVVLVDIVKDEIAKPGIPAERFLSWQPSPTSEVSEDTVPRPIQIARKGTTSPEVSQNSEESPKFVHDIGEEAIAVSAAPEKVWDKNESLKGSPENLQASDALISDILGHDGEGGGSLGNILRTLGSDPEAIRKSLERSDAHKENRESVASILRVRVNQLRGTGSLSDAVENDDQVHLKTVPLGFGYEDRQYTSEEYAVLLALSKLDGTFDIRKSKQSRFDDLPADHPHNGQHRQSAEAILQSFQDEQHDVVKSVEYAEGEAMQRLQRQVNESLPQIPVELLMSLNHFDLLLEMRYAQMVDTHYMTELTAQIYLKLDSAESDLAGLMTIINKEKTDIAAQSADGRDSAKVDTLEDTIRASRGALRSIKENFGHLRRAVDSIEYDQGGLIHAKNYLNKYGEAMFTDIARVRALLSEVSL
jgi:hypothetical protein